MGPFGKHNLSQTNTAITQSPLYSLFIAKQCKNPKSFEIKPSIFDLEYDLNYFQH
jgi:hypothetical protein